MQFCHSNRCSYAYLRGTTLTTERMILDPVAVYIHPRELHIKQFRTSYGIVLSFNADDTYKCNYRHSPHITAASLAELQFAMWLWLQTSGLSSFPLHLKLP